MGNTFSYAITNVVRVEKFIAGTTLNVKPISTLAFDIFLAFDVKMDSVHMENIFTSQQIAE